MAEGSQAIVGESTYVFDRVKGWTVPGDGGGSGAAPSFIIRVVPSEDSTGVTITDMSGETTYANAAEIWYSITDENLEPKQNVYALIYPPDDPVGEMIPLQYASAGSGKPTVRFGNMLMNVESYFTSAWVFGSVFYTIWEQFESLAGQINEIENMLNP